MVLAFAYQVRCEDEEACDEGVEDLGPLNGTDNGISALEIKIETEQAQESFNDLLERIINLADEMIQEVNDALGELSIAGPKVEMDAVQGRDYVVTHSGMIKATAFRLWRDGKNVTKMIEDSAELIMAEDASSSLPEPTTTTTEPNEEGEGDGGEEGEGEEPEDGESEEEGGEKEAEEEKRARRQADDDNDDDNEGNDEDEEAEDEGSEGNSTEAAGNATSSDPVAVAAPVDVQAEAAKITEMTKTLSNQYNEGLKSIIDETERIKIIYSFQVFNIQKQGEATAETKEDSDDTLAEITVFADKIIESTGKLQESADATYGFILKTAAKIV